MRKSLFTFSLLLPASLLFGQAPITGKVNGEGAVSGPLPGANVLWAGTTIGAATDGDGRFSVPPPDQWPARLVVTYVGFRNDTLLLERVPDKPVVVTLSSSVELNTVEVVERVSGTQLSTRSTIAQEIIGEKELKRAACCDLSESFETNATVDVNYSDAISGTKTIRMLGLDGRYAQISLENLPFIRGLSSSYGLTLLPGTWIQDINLSKGLGTSVNGPNAMTGQIDLCLRDPLSEGPFFLNLYGNSQGRTEANIHSAQSTGKNSGNIILLHGNLFQQEMDQNKDGFLDQPLTKRFNVMDRWMRRTERGMTQIGVRYVTDDRQGGQTARSIANEVLSPTGRPYTVDIRNEMVDVFGKQGVVFKNDPTKSIGFLFAGRQHNAASRFGDRNYTGKQESLYGSLVYQMLLGKGTDQLKAGASFQFDDYSEAFRDSTFGRTERMPGVFAEYTLQRSNFILVAGVRGDHNSVYGNVVSPRMHMKYDLGPLTTVRLSAGQGFRTANPLIETGSVLASSRSVVVEGNLGMEKAWNFGASFLHKFKFLDRKWVFGVDVYRTEFTAQVVTDLDRSPQTVAFYMLDGPSFANSVLSDVQVELTRQLHLRLSYRFYDTRTTFDGKLRERPFTPSHRGLIDLAWGDRKERWRTDVTLNLFGQGRVPNTMPNPEEFRMTSRSPAYTTLHAQITRVLGAWEVYLGAENLTSTLQQQQIIAPEDPFGPYFDASLIWGPTNKAMIYGGLRFTIDKKKKQQTQNP
ncbi:MAG: TonB-dependent receptor [Flavobacteriales bacterium]|nr:TonB-dependent receptor [Flavobacteriales bacterium]